MDSKERLQFFYKRLNEIHVLAGTYSLLEWDQQVNMPPDGAAERAKQLECIETMRHNLTTDEKFIEIIQDLHNGIESLSYPDQVNVRETWRTCNRQKKLSAEFVGRKTRVCSESYSAWAEARPANDFELVRPHLESIIALHKEEIDLVGYDLEPYDALLDVYEKGATLSVIRPVFVRLAEALSSILPAIPEAFTDVAPIKGDFPEPEQLPLIKKVMTSLGFDFRSGRLDSSPHPFCTTMGRGDVRVTTRYSKDNFLGSLYGVIHETGHALYDMGLPAKWYGTPMGSPASLGVHESQSRFFENILGKSRAFCEWLFTILPDFFPGTRYLTTPDELWKQVNSVSRSLIRVEADEVTYSLHVIIRTLLEDDLVRGVLQVRDLPEAWNSLYEKYIGIRPSNYSDGVLQDVHWYSGMIGYFPTYVLGNLYGASMLQGLTRDLPSYLDDVSKGVFKNVLSWLRANVHQKGMQHTGPELVEGISGSALDESAFLKYLSGKYLHPA